MLTIGLIIAIFVIGYLSIALEHTTHIDKAASALLTGVLCWTVYVLNVDTMLPESEVPVWFKAFHADASATDVSDFDDSALSSMPADSHQAEPSTSETGESFDVTAESPTGIEVADSDTHSDDDHGDEDHSGGDHSDSSHSLNLDYLVEGQLLVHLGEIASILFFLMGAMTIVEIVDAFEGFSVITNRIKATNKVSLLWIVCGLSFAMSAVLDNLTSTIVMVSLLKKLVKDQNTRLIYAGMVVIAANAGGAWTVIGDVTTTMLWIKNKIDPVTVMQTLILPSIVCMVVPILWISRSMKGTVERPDKLSSTLHKKLKPYHQYLFLFVGLAALLFVPVFKTVTHLPPFMGMMLSLGFVWLVAELIKHDLDESTRSSTHVLEVLKRVDSSSILFFLGILLAISCLASTGLLRSLAAYLGVILPSDTIIALLIGLLSAVVDNVPLVAAGIEMYDKPVDSHFWLFLAYCAGTGGSCLIIGSAAGVAAMGLERIDFVWYLKRMGPLALAGYLAGALTYLIQQWLFNFPSGGPFGP